MASDNKLKKWKKIVLSLSLISLILIVLMYGIKTYIAVVNVTPEYPKKGTIALPSFNSQVSEISLPVQVEIDTLEKNLANLIPKSFRQKFNIKVKNAKSAYLEPDLSFSNISLRAENNFLVIHANISGEVRGGAKFNPLPIGGGFWIRSGVKLSKNSSFTVKISPTINPNWQLTSSVNAYVNIPEAKIDRLGIRVDKEVQREINKVLKRDVPKKVNVYLSKIDVKKEAKKVWDQANRIEKITVEDYSIWLKTTPQGVIFKPFDLSDTNYLKTGVGVIIKTEAFIEKPSATPIPPLPKLKIKNDMKGFYVINLPVRATTAGINTIIAEKFDDFEANFENRIKFHIKDMSLDIVDDQMILGVSFEASKGLFAESAKGTIYLKGKIDYNNKTGILKVAELDYTAETNQIMEKLVTWLAKHLICKTIQERFIVDMNAELNKAKQTAIKALKEFKFSEGINVAITVDQLEMKELILNKDIFIVFNAKGSLSSEISQFKF